MVLEDYTYVFVIGTMFAMLDAYNNGASKWLPPSFFDGHILISSA